MPTSRSAENQLDNVLQRHRNDPTRLMQILREVQEDQGWIRPSAISYLATSLGVPRARVEGVAGFYSFFYTEPVGQYRVLFSDNITDRMQGNVDLLNRLCVSRF